MPLRLCIEQDDEERERERYGHYSEPYDRNESRQQTCKGREKIHFSPIFSPSGVEYFFKPS